MRLFHRYKGRKMDGVYPKDISEGFTGIPDDLDAALVWSGNGKIYFYKGSKFWRFDPSQRPPVKSTYPKPISNWEGVPDNLDAAFQWTNGYTYFYKGNAYYRLVFRNCFNDNKHYILHKFVKKSLRVVTKTEVQNFYLTSAMECNENFYFILQRYIYFLFRLNNYPLNYFL